MDGHGSGPFSERSHGSGAHPRGHVEKDGLPSGHAILRGHDLIMLVPGSVAEVLFLVFASFTSAYLVMGSRLPLRALIEKAGCHRVLRRTKNSGAGAL